MLKTCYIRALNNKREHFLLKFIITDIGLLCNESCFGFEKYGHFILKTSIHKLLNKQVILWARKKVIIQISNCRKQETIDLLSMNTKQINM